ncbi:FHA domain-containing protein [Tautonia rosea]|uniref:FHA domain-containing protein n=1 Tax=Tautonia rosea TaxID=2728037 RepID=UPI0036F42A05
MLPPRRDDVPAPRTPSVRSIRPEPNDLPDHFWETRPAAAEPLPLADRVKRENPWETSIPSQAPPTDSALLAREIVPGQEFDTAVGPKRPQPIASPDPRVQAPASPGSTGISAIPSSKSPVEEVRKPSRPLVSPTSRAPSSANATYVPGITPGSSEERDSSLLRLEILAGDGESIFERLATISSGEFTLGRSAVEQFVGRGSATRHLADRHLRFVVDEDDHLVVEDLGTVNGVYLKIPEHSSVPLTEGSRFRVGRHVIVFREASSVSTPSPLVSPSGEVFYCREFSPRAFLEFIGPDGQPAASVPITKTDLTVIGREGEGCDIALTGDHWVSRRHACLREREGHFVLEDLGSKNGTFLKMGERTRIRVGDRAFPDSADIVLIGELHFRVTRR